MTDQFTLARQAFDALLAGGGTADALEAVDQLSEEDRFVLKFRADQLSLLCGDPRNAFGDDYRAPRSTVVSQETAFNHLVSDIIDTLHHIEPGTWRPVADRLRGALRSRIERSAGFDWFRSAAVLAAEERVEGYRTQASGYRVMADNARIALEKAQAAAR